MAWPSEKSPPFKDMNAPRCYVIPTFPILSTLFFLFYKEKKLHYNVSVSLSPPQHTYDYNKLTMKYGINNTPWQLLTEFFRLLGLYVGWFRTALRCVLSLKIEEISSTAAEAYDLAEIITLQ